MPPGGEAIGSGGGAFTGWAVLQVLVLLGGAAAALWMERRWRWVALVGPVVISYGFGLLLGNLRPFPLDVGISLGLGGLSVALAIPLLLFSVDLAGWLRLARATVVSFLLCVVSVLLVAGTAGVLFRGRLSESAQVAGMLVGVYTGGTPNMSAIGRALGVAEETFVLVNAADIVLGSMYLLFLLTLAGRVLGRLFPPFEPRAGVSDGERASSAQGVSGLGHRGAWVGVALALVIVALGLALGRLAPESAQEAVVVLVITVLGLAASLVPRVRAIPGTHELGQAVLLVFCIAVGATAELSRLAAALSVVFGITAVVLFGSIVLHFLLARVLRIDRDTAIITSAAAVFGPPFIAPVAAALGNREILLSGLATGLVGYAVGTFLGLGLAWALG
jgi:uncharacterized membrane protein